MVTFDSTIWYHLSTLAALTMPQTPASQTIPRLPKLASLTTSTATRWQAVVTRDPTASFVYAVLTTKIYCRPSCAARLARRANVEFYDTPSQAEKAGFRPCKRCKPEETLENAVNSQVALVQRACHTVMADIRSGSKPTLSKLAGEAGLTPSHFHRVFKKVMGVTPGKYVAAFMREGERAPLSLAADNRSTVENRDMGMFQPWGEIDQNAWLAKNLDWLGNPGSGCGGLGGAVGASGDNALLWNDFDVLIAAEAEYASRQEV
ncbi:metal binding domain of Ada-domain-containing protein [Aspergillus recurvatus]